MADHNPGPPVTVYLSARVYDKAREIKRRTRAGKTKRSGGMRHCFSIRLERWTPQEVEQHIIDLFTRLATEEACAENETRRTLETATVKGRS
jgi:hypothetical protein